MQPHNPWYFNERCERIKVNEFSNEQLFTFSVECFQVTLDHFVSTVLSVDPEAIILLHGDHGWVMDAPDILGVLEYKWPIHKLEQRSEIYSAIRSPKSCHRHLHSSLGPINLTRYMLACVQNIEPNFVEEKLFIPGPTHDSDEKLIEFDLSKFHFKTN